ncbi:MAG: hypothetical protein MUE44_36155 [Oscillatoriaceae cyanobacterium Prado104]|jgi:hypothetical protein|nr:hypothetical protein [Oscillatoriaceae cyanobacterium Prado104]
MNDRPSENKTNKSAADRKVKVLEVDVDPVTLLAVIVALLFVPLIFAGFAN